MLFSTSYALGLGLTLVGTVSTLPSSSNIYTKDFAPSDIIHKDVLVIGCGATGTYGAIKLLDAQKTVIVVEAKATCGGHTEVSINPTNGKPVNLGVKAYHNNDFVKGFFARLKVPLGPTSFNTPPNTFVDFSTGKVVADYKVLDPTAAIGTYFGLLQQYPYLESSWNLTYPVPEDLLLPFGEYMKKHDLTNIAQLILGFAQGLGNVLDQPTVYVFKNFGSEVIQALSTGFLAASSGNNNDLYTSASTELQSSASLLLSSTILSMDRSSNPARAVVQTPSGPKLILAKQILLTSPPKVELLKWFGLNDEETSLFSQFNSSAYYTGLLRNSGVPENTNLVNSSPDNEYNLPNLPGAYGLQSVANNSDLTAVWYGSPTELSSSEVQSRIQKAVTLMGENGIMPRTQPNKLEFAAWSSHTPFELTVSADAIRGGFYKNLYALQGQRGTWYTGAAWHTHDSSMLWSFTEGVVEKMVASL